MTFKPFNSRASHLALLIIVYFLYPITSSAQVSTTVVKGLVQGAGNQPLTGVSVVIRNSKTNFTTGTQTDSAGIFTSRVPAGGPYSFAFTNVGYESQTLSGYQLKEGATITIDVEMKVASGSLEQVIVVGYGTKKRSDVTGSVASVPKERLSQLPVTNALQAIQGAVAGVNITQSSSVPGAAPSAVVRGESSISASTGPFVVVDGVPFNGSINDINTNDIASI
ncbi:MAG: carboxypeptidase regulatory-like domain-containing protein, partial [Ferruginibacter sp.]